MGVDTFHLSRLKGWCEEQIGLRRPWWRDVSDFYGVCRDTALALGTRAAGRRPLAFGGRTFEEIWASATRETPEQIADFYRDLGPWLVFRQVVRHRWRSWQRIGWDVARPASRFLEYGCGIAPVTFWLAEHRPRRFPYVLLMDLPSEPLRFADWRLARLRPRDWEILPAGQPLPTVNVIACLEVLEHVPDPVATGDMLLNALRPGGVLWEDFFAHGDAHAADLPQSQARRPIFYEMLRRRARLTYGRPPEAPDGGGTRRWQKR